MRPERARRGCSMMWAALGGESAGEPPDLRPGPPASAERWIWRSRSAQPRSTGAVSLLACGGVPCSRCSASRPFHPLRACKQRAAHPRRPRCLSPACCSRGLRRKNGAQGPPPHEISQELITLSAKTACPPPSHPNVSGPASDNQTRVTRDIVLPVVRPSPYPFKLRRSQPHQSQAISKIFGPSRPSQCFFMLAVAHASMSRVYQAMSPATFSNPILVLRKSLRPLGARVATGM